jgi:stage III sporulation protein AB
MIFKLAGLLAVFTCCAAAGISKSNSISKRVRQLEAFSNAIALVSTEIRYFASPVDVLMAKLNSLAEYKDLRAFGICHRNFRKCRDFQKAWEDAINESKQFLSLDEGDYETLLWLGQVLGTTDVEGQTASCERYRELINQRLSQARADQASKGKMYTSLGILAGAFVFVLLI